MCQTIPNCVWKTRVPSNPDAPWSERKGWEWKDISTSDYFNGKRVILFSLPGAFTPTCTEQQLPGFEENYDQIRNLGIDEIFCISVNDSFVMNAWAKREEIENVKVIADGNGEFTRMMGMLVDKHHLGFGQRSWRYAMIIDDGNIEYMWVEPGINNKGEDFDPYGETSPENIIEYLKRT
jgi:thioredoxin-dependent peroxiredoxin